MSTRSRIGIEDEHGIRSVYCHYDGAASFGQNEHCVGKVLSEHYVDREKVERLLDRGDLTSLGHTPDPHPTECSGFPRMFACKEHTVAGSDHGRAGHPQRAVAGRADFLEMARSSWASYAYLFTRDGWRVAYVAPLDAVDDSPFLPIDQLDPWIRRQD